MASLRVLCDGIWPSSRPALSVCGLDCGTPLRLLLAPAPDLDNLSWCHVFSETRSKQRGGGAPEARAKY
eukprot:3946721-Amphidinium_carterae.1